ncbi:MAG TPA: hypothetical protein PKD18_24760, partial [Saprospiraceae bacterium]|nr:hypothetical protein [Saprospiraceae bacterium]
MTNLFRSTHLIASTLLYAKSSILIMTFPTKLHLFIILFFLGFQANAQDLPPATSLVYPGVDGKLTYIADSLGNTIPDFSNAGYEGGGKPIPYVAAKETVWPVLGDNSENIQKAIDKVSAMPLSSDGFRGAILLKMGHYQLDKPVYIRASG